MANPPYGGYPPEYHYHHHPRSNGLGTAGFVLALLGLLLGVFAMITIFYLFPLGALALALLGIGFLLSFLGLFRAPRGLAIAGLVLSLLPVAFVFGVTGTLVSLIP